MARMMIVSVHETTSEKTLVRAESLTGSSSIVEILIELAVVQSIVFQALYFVCL